MDVTKSEAIQIICGGVGITNNINYLVIATNTDWEFRFTHFGDDDTLLTNDKYKDYEWRLIDRNDLNQGDVCKLPTNSSDICVFDKLLPNPNKRPERLSELSKGCYLFWFIHTNRPLTISNYNILEVYKLFEKGDK